MCRTHRLSLLTLAVLTLGCAAPLHAATVTITPAASIAAAAGRLQPGDTLVLAAGTYRETLQDVFPGGASWEQPVTITAAPGATVILQAASPTSGAYPGFALVLSQPSQQYLVFEGLIFDGVNRTQNTVAVTGNCHTASDTTCAHHIRFLNCEFRHSATEVSLSHTHHVEFVGGSVHDNGDTSGLRHGLYLASEVSDTRIENMGVCNNQGYGIHVYNLQGSGSDRLTIRGNTLRNNALCCQQDQILVSGSAGSVVEGNLVQGGGGGGINIGYAGGASAITVQGNTVVGTPGPRPGIWIAAGSGHQVIGNRAWDNRGGDLDIGRAAVQRDNVVGSVAQHLAAALVAGAPGGGCPAGQGGQASRLPAPRNLRAVRLP